MNLAKFRLIWRNSDSNLAKSASRELARVKLLSHLSFRIEHGCRSEDLATALTRGAVRRRTYATTRPRTARGRTRTALNPRWAVSQSAARQGDARSKERQVRGNHVNANRKAGGDGKPFWRPEVKLDAVMEAGGDGKPLWRPAAN